ncbi:MAG TPA: DUF2935 domain-containing protein [Clostridiaceae bacterium]|nr:DUF2935 domain-containing protein [Clostridiaceae bacterium]
MLSRQEFIKISIETNLFFQRIMKEHLFFIQTNLQPVNHAYIAEANMLKQGFEKLLAETVHYARGVVSEDALQSNEIVTPYTLRAEEVSSMLTGASLDTGITRSEYKLAGTPNCYYTEWLENAVYGLNGRSCFLLEKVIVFKKKLLALASGCKIFIDLYQELLEHITYEAEYYMEILRSLQARTLPKKTLCEELNFWNHVMGDHAEFIDGMLDPTEKSLKETAKATAETFEKLVENCVEAAENQIINRSLESTEEIRDFKRASTEGILNCKIKSIIPPLLADHVLREANHYLRLLKMMKK